MPARIRATSPGNVGYVYGHVRWLSLILIVFFAAPALAQSNADKSTARRLFFQASAAEKLGDHAQAEDLYRRSNSLYAAPTAHIGLARALAAQGKLVAAAESYNDLLRVPLASDAPPAFKSAHRHARAELTALEPRIPTVVVIVEGPSDPTLSIDGVAVAPAAIGISRVIDPGAHEFVASGAGHSTATKTVTFSEGDKREIRLTPTKTAPDAAAPSPAPSSDAAAVPVPVADDTSAGDSLSWALPVGIGALALGGAGLVVAGVSGGIYYSEKSTVESSCAQQPTGEFRCNAEGLAAVDAGETAAEVNTLSVIAGAVLVAGGVVLVLVGSDDGGKQAAVVPHIAPTAVGVGLEGRF